MIEFSLINQFLALLIIATGIWLALWVYLTDRKAKVNQSFCLMTIFIILWIIFGYLANTSTQLDQATFLFRLNHGAVSLFMIAAYFFLTSFPHREKNHPILDKIVLVFGLILFLVSLFTNWIIQGAEFKEWGVDIIYGEEENFFSMIIITLTLLILGLFLKRYFRLPKEEKLKVQYLLIGVLIFALMNLIFNVVLSARLGYSKFYYLGDYSAIFLLGFTAYAIIKRKLFGIKVALISFFVAFIGILLSLDILIFTQEISLKLFKLLILVFFLYLGYLLVKSVINEIKRREELEKLTSELQITHIRLEASYKGMQELAKSLEEKVKERTKELQKRVNELEKFHKVTVGRELKMVELKKEVKRLNEELGKKTGSEKV